MQSNEEAVVQVSVAGRVLAKRVFGKLAFYEIADGSGSIQLYLEKSMIDAAMPASQSDDSAFEDLKSLVDVGDFIGVSGGIKRTDKGELSVLVEKYSMLTKSILPLPDKFKGLTDVNIRYRRRQGPLLHTKSHATMMTMISCASSVFVLDAY